MSAGRTAAGVVAMAVAGVCAGLGADALMRSGVQPAGEILPATIGELRLAVPDAFLRFGTRLAATERVDAVLRHPEMAPASKGPFTGASAADSRALVFLALTRADGGVDPAERARDLYGRFLEPDAWQNPGGLLLRRFQAGSPYEDEEIYIAPPDGRDFTARCRRPGKGAEAIGDSCLWRYRRDGADVQVRFSPDLLPQWEMLTTGVRERVESWVAKPARP